MSESLPAIVDESPGVAALRQEYEARLAALTEQQATAVRLFLASGSKRDALIEAGYSRPGQDARRVFGNAAVAAAVRAGIALREVADPLTREGALGFLERMLSTTLQDLFITNEDGQPIGVRAFETLSPAQQRAVKTMTATIRKSAKGERACLVKLDVEFYSAVEVIREIARLRGWAVDSPLVDLHVDAINEIRAGVKCPPLVEELADAVLDDAELAEWVDADDRRKVEMIRAAATRLRGLRS